jgi:hypothetical protein
MAIAKGRLPAKECGRLLPHPLPWFFVFAETLGVSGDLVAKLGGAFLHFG